MTITIAGTNDDAAISGTATGATQEDCAQRQRHLMSPTSTPAKPSSSAERRGRKLRRARARTAAGEPGPTRSANGTNGVASAVQSLAAARSRTDTFTVRQRRQGGLEDQVVTITITGTNDAATIAGTATGAPKRT